MDNFSEVIQDYWESFLAFSPLLIIGLIILIISIFIAIWISASVNKNLSKRMDDPLLVRFISRIIKGFLIVIGLFLALQIIGFGGIAAGLLASAGLSAFVIGFALKDIVENFLAGIILSFDRPFDLHDTISVNSHLGSITALDFRNTKIKTFDGKDIYIPNATIIKQSLTNYTRDRLVRLEFMVGVRYGSDIERAKSFIIDTLLNLDKVLKEKKPYVITDEFSADTVNIRVFFWTSTFDYKKEIYLVKGNAISSVQEVLQAEGFEKITIKNI